VFRNNRNDILVKLEAAGFKGQNLPLKVVASWEYSSESLQPSGSRAL
jgi:hypothetical protein